MNSTDSGRWTLRDLPLAARLAIASFLISVGIGYFSAMVQLHFQHAKPGSLLPTTEDSIKTFHGTSGDTPKSRLVRLIEADDNLPFNGNGQMSAAFTSRSQGWKTSIKEKAKNGAKSGEADLAEAEKKLREERDSERMVVVEWLSGGAKWDVYEKDRYPIPESLKGKPFTSEFLSEEGEPAIKIKSLWTERCVRCHSKEGEDAKASEYPLDSQQAIAKYNKVEESGGAMSLTKLAQTTHVHLLGFSMLYGLTGLILALTSYSSLIRVPLAPLALIAQVVDISCWWLARMDAPYGPFFASVIPVSGGIVGASLGLQILLSLFDVFEKGGKVILLLLALLGAGAGFVAKTKVIDPHLSREVSPARTN
ncbi:MAG: hypothetical protein ACKO23_08395 [Gemmataceae bacterium]